MRKDAQAVLLVLVGGALLKISYTGTYLRYVKPSSRWLLIAAGLALIAVATVTLWQVVRGQRSDHDGHEHHGEPRIGWLLLLPALALLLLSPPAIGSFQAGRSGTALTAPANSDFAALPDGDPVRLSVLDYASRAVFDHGRTLTGRRITMSGFVLAGPNGTAYLARMVLTCCAADARPIKIGLAGDLTTGLKPDAWIEVDGTYNDRTDRDPINNDAIPYFQVSAVRAIPAPESQYDS